MIKDLSSANMQKACKRQIGHKPIAHPSSSIYVKDMWSSQHCEEIVYLALIACRDNLAMMAMSSPTERCLWQTVENAHHHYETHVSDEMHVCGGHCIID